MNCKITSKCFPKSLPEFTSRLGKLWGVFIVVFFGFVMEGLGQSTTPPTYTWMSEVSLPTVNISLSGVNTEDITISVATDPEGNVYTLTFGKGVSKRSPTGALINANFIPASKFDSPLDMAIDEDGFIYIADYFAGGETFADNGKIWVFDSNGTFLSSRTILTSFYRPLGLDVDDHNVYVAEFNDGNSGPEPDVLSRVRIYNKNTAALVRETNQVDTPFRIAVDSRKNVFVSQAGNTTPSVRIFNENLVYQNSLPNIFSPGSVVIDGFDFIHVIEYDGRVDFNQFINFENLSVSQAQAIAKKIDDGQRADAFSIKVFDPNRVLRLTLKDQIDFPVDLAFNTCDRMYVNNAKVYGSSYPFLGYIPEKIEFDLEIYQRSPSLDTQFPEISCPADITAEANPGDDFAVVNYTDPVASDNCAGFTVTRTKGFGSGSEFPLGETEVEFTVTDAVGNKSTCTFKVTVTAADQPLDITCPDDQTEERDENCKFTVPDYTSMVSATTNATLTQEPEKGTVIDANTTVTVVAILGEETKECSFEIILIDSINPVITCPGTQTETFDPDEGFTLPDYTLDASASDNCGGQTVTQSPVSGTLIYEDTEVTLLVTDSSNNSSECKFMVNLQAEVEEPATFENCVDITVDNDPGECGAIVNFSLPTASDANGNVEVNQTQGPASGSFFQVGTTTLTFEATGSNGTKVECQINVTVEDSEAPIFTSCLGDEVQEEILTDGEFILPDYSEEMVVADNCSQNFTFTQDPPVGSSITESRYVHVFAYDEEGNESHSCSFLVNLNEEEVFEIGCPSEKTEYLDSNCEFKLPDYTSEATVNMDGASVTQTPEPGTIISVSTAITLTGKHGEKEDTCVFQLTLEDDSIPLFTCPQNPFEQYDPSTGFTLPDYTVDINPTDNCGIKEVVQDPPAGTVINENTLIKIFVTDLSNNTSECTFLVNLESNEALEINCLEDQQGSLGSNCNYTVPDFTGNAEVNNENATITQSPEVGAIINSSSIITLTATFEEESVSCEFQLTLTDSTLPLINCPSDQNEFFDPAVGFTLPDYTGSAVTSDNCGIAGISQTPEAGTVISEDTQISLVITDTSGNTQSCAFTVTLSEDEVLQISCPDDQMGNFGPDCRYEVPDYRGSAEVNSTDAEVSQNPAPGTFVSESTSIVLTATLGDETDTCSFQLILTDAEHPVFTCPQDQNESLDSQGEFSVPDYREMANPTDNCEFVWLQTPAPGTILTESTMVTLSATDNAGNETWCTFTIRLTEPNEFLEITCPENKTAEPGENCEFTLPDYTAEATVNIDGAHVTQSPAPGTVIDQNTIITFVATFEDQIDTCTFEINLEDTVKPEIIECPVDKTENYNSEGTFVLPDYKDFVTASDNCGIAEIIQNPAPGTVLSRDEFISFQIRDNSGNISECVFTLFLTDDETLNIECPQDQTGELNENCQFEVPDYTDQAQVNFENAVVTQSPAQGTLVNADTSIILTATFEGKTDMCTFQVIIEEDRVAPIANCIATGAFRLNENGMVTITPDLINNNSTDNCAIESMSLDKTEFTTADLGEQTVVLTVEDAVGNTDSCETMIEILPFEGTGSTFTCKAEFVLELDEAGEATITAEDLYTGESDGKTFSISQSAFTCEHTGENTVTLSYESVEDSGSCEVKVKVRDNMAPVARGNNITVFLDENGHASISADMVNNGSSDNCGDISLSIDVEDFTCKDLGPNEVTLTVTDANGNSSDVTATVTVTGNCQIVPPSETVEYIILYPNPTSGPFTIATPRDIQLFRAEVYDSRGRFLFARAYPESNTNRYEMDITGVESAIYILKLITSDGDKVLRVIIN